MSEHTLGFLLGDLWVTTCAVEVVSDTSEDSDTSVHWRAGSRHFDEMDNR